MNEEEILEYISNNEPTKVTKCPISDRWETREWKMKKSTIIENYTYKNKPLHRQSFAVESVIREEVQNG